jgi:hypothetical protein
MNDVRPGVVLSRTRSLAAVAAAFNTPEGRESLFPDALAMMNDAHLSGQDFLATLPEVRAIERQHLAVGLEKNPEVINKVLEETAAIENAAAKSDAVAPGALTALRENEADIREAKTVEVAADLVADKLLIIRNFVSEGIRYIARQSAAAGTEVWHIVKPELEVGLRSTARMLPQIAVAALLESIGVPITGISAALKGPLFKPVSSAISKVRRSKSSPQIGTGGHTLNQAAAVLRLEPDVLEKLIDVPGATFSLRAAAAHLGMTPLELERMIANETLPKPGGVIDRASLGGRQNYVFTEEWLERARRILNSPPL